MSRRGFVHFGSLAVGSLSLASTSLLSSCSDDAVPVDTDTTPIPPLTEPVESVTVSTTSPVVPDPLTSSRFESLESCQLTPAQSEGPFYLADDLVRQNIIEDRTGLPARVGIRVLDEACEPVGGVMVDIWHADAFGDYSAFVDGSIERGEAGPGTTFLRGTQVTDAEGIVEFLTIWPGWYRGRAVHIHLKVRSATGTFTTQMYFPDDINSGVYSSEPYALRGVEHLDNIDDPIAGDIQTNGLLASVTDSSTSIGPGKLILFLASING